jgi:hypothetical protein
MAGRGNERELAAPGSWVPLPVARVGDEEGDMDQQETLMRSWDPSYERKAVALLAIEFRIGGFGPVGDRAPVPSYGGGPEPVLWGSRLDYGRARSLLGRFLDHFGRSLGQGRSPKGVDPGDDRLLPTRWSYRTCHGTDQPAGHSFAHGDLRGRFHSHKHRGHVGGFQA